MNDWNVATSNGSPAQKVLLSHAAHFSGAKLTVYADGVVSTEKSSPWLLHDGAVQVNVFSRRVNALTMNMYCTWSMNSTSLATKHSMSFPLHRSKWLDTADAALYMPTPRPIIVHIDTGDFATEWLYVFSAGSTIRDVWSKLRRCLFRPGSIRFVRVMRMWPKQGTITFECIEQSLQWEFRLGDLVEPQSFCGPDIHPHLTLKFCKFLDT